MKAQRQTQRGAERPVAVMLVAGIGFLLMALVKWSAHKSSAPLFAAIGVADLIIALVVFMKARRSGPRP